jgi:hypothetical protein
MKSKTVVVLQVLLLLIGIFNATLGIGLNVSPGFPHLVEQYYGATVEFTPALLYLVKPIGAFMLTVGIMAIAAARDPLRHSAIVYGLVLLFVVRGFQRFVFQDEIARSVGIEASRNIGNGIFFLLLGVALFVLYRMSNSPADRTA